MRTRVSRYIAIGVFIIIGVGGYSQAESNIKVENKAKKEVQKGKTADVDLPVIKLKVDNQTSSNPKLKKGKGCEDLEEVKGKEFSDYPLAETVPCDKVDCKDLEPAQLGKSEYREASNKPKDRMEVVNG